jgi:phage-related protein (TIGR01555 family)
MYSFSVMVLKTDMDTRISNSTMISRIEGFNKFRDNRGTFVIDKNTEEFDNVAAPIAGLDKLQAQALEQIAAVSGIPLVVLLGQTPSGLNASSDGEIRVFYDKVLAYLEKVVGPALHTIFDIVQLSLFGEIDQKIGFKFLPLWEMSDKDKADIRKSDAEADATYINAGVVSPEETRARLNDEEDGAYNGMLAGPAPEPVDEGNGYELGGEDPAPETGQ